jgi:hypothetical protein
LFEKGCAHLGVFSRMMASKPFLVSDTLQASLKMKSKDEKCLLYELPEGYRTSPGRYPECIGNAA